MAIDVDDSTQCPMCGGRYSKRKGYYSVSWASMWKASGYLPICKKCVEKIYNTYLNQCHDGKSAVRQTCRKLDLYWNESIYNEVATKAGDRSILQPYLAKINTQAYTGLCYDDTLEEEDSLWRFGVSEQMSQEGYSEEDGDSAPIYSFSGSKSFELNDDIIAFWGLGYTKNMYRDLEQRRHYWMSRLPEDMEVDAGTEAIIRQICSLELDINRDRLEGKPVEKSVNALNNLLGSANLKPAQRKDDLGESLERTPFGVWIQRWENKRPIPEPDPELQDADGIVKYVLTWLYGHLGKMLNIKNSYTRMYEDAIQKYRVEKPEYMDEDDNAMLDDIFGSDDQDEDDE